MAVQRESRQTQPERDKQRAHVDVDEDTGLLHSEAIRISHSSHETHTERKTHVAGVNSRDGDEGARVAVATVDDVDLAARDLSDR